MSDNNPTPDYQDILDKYADSLKSTDEPLVPEPSPDVQPEAEAIISQPQPEIKSQSEPKIQLPAEPQLESQPKAEPLTPEAPPEVQLETPQLESEPETTPEVKTEPQPEIEPPPLPQTELPPESFRTVPLTPPIELPFETPPDAPPKENHFFKYLFFFSLIIFILVLISVIFSVASSQKSVPSTENIPTITLSPTDIPIPVCEINDRKYAVGESFFATDGCNTCSCTSDLTIICTEMACDATPSTTLAPIKTATISATITPTEISTP